MVSNFIEAKENIKPDSIIMKLIFTSILGAVQALLKRAKIPTYLLAELMVFWGGVQNSFNGFAHKPIDYTKQVNCPTLILQGELDSTVNMQKIEALQQNINATKKLVFFPQAGHQSLVNIDRKLWQENVEDFLDDL